MTSSPSPSAATIVCSAKQTCFHTGAANYRELDIEGLCITVAAAAADDAPSTAGQTRAARSAARAARGVEILSGASLRLKQGRRYALVGRNGTGKSVLLRAVADKLIPGVPEETRIAILQQTRLADHDDGLGAAACAEQSVLEQVVDKATARDAVEQEIRVLSEGVASGDADAPVRALRTLKHRRLQQRLFRFEKEARLRSGARGLQARKALVAFEKVVEESSKGLEVDIGADGLQAETQEAADMLAHLQLQVEPSRIARVEAKARSILTGLGFSDERLKQSTGSLSGGWHMRASLAAVLLQEADILILDEPTNFLDLLGIVWLQRYLDALDTTTDTPPTVILVSHDRDFAGLCTDLLILKDRQLTCFHGDLPTFEASQAERRLWLSKMSEAQDRQRAHMEKTIQQNMKAGKANDDQNKLRQAKSRQKKLEDRTGMQVNAKGGRFKLNRDMAGWHEKAREDIDIPPEERSVVVKLPEPPDLRFPGSLLSLDGASFRYSAQAPLVIRDATLNVGILGLNGAGKSTLVKLLVDGARPTSGTVTTHPRLRMGYYPQHAVEALKALARDESQLTALSLLTRDVDGHLAEGHVRALLGELGLPGRVASDVPLGKLSGGQLVRCELARLLWRRPHCLLLDEITTHLDYETVTALRVALCHWEGAVVLISHDRWFMRGVVEGLLDGDGDGDGDGGSAADESPRRRIVCRLKGGSLSVLGNGVDEFEALMEKRVSRLLAA